MPRIVICVRCGRERVHYAKEKCHPCYAMGFRQTPEAKARHAASERVRRKRLGPEYRRQERERNKRRKKQRAKNMRDWQHNNREHISQYFKDYRKREPQKERAREAVHYQVKNGRMPSPLTLKCDECGQPAKDYHHHKGYSEKYKLDVIPLCKYCHGKTKRI